MKQKKPIEVQIIQNPKLIENEIAKGLYTIAHAVPNDYWIGKFKVSQRVRIVSRSSDYWRQKGLITRIETWGYSGMVLLDGRVKAIHFYFWELEDSK